MDRFTFNELQGLNRIARQIIALVRPAGAAAVSSGQGAALSSTQSDVYSTELSDGSTQHDAIYGLDVYNDPNSKYGRDK